MHRYAPRYRPPGFATMPAGWELVERGTGGYFPARIDLPDGSHRFGVVQFAERLSDEDREKWELDAV